MAITTATADDQYKKFPQLNREDALKLLDWCQKQPHLPNITGKSKIFYLLNLLFK